MKTLGSFLFLLPFLFSFSATATPLHFTGKLQQTAEGNYLLVNAQNSYPLVFPKTVADEVKSLVGKVPYIEITDGVLENGSIHSQMVPTIASGDQFLEGVLVRKTENNHESFQIQGVPVKFGPTIEVNGTHFDGQSRQYFSNRNVRALGHTEGAVFVITSLVRRDVFSAKSASPVDPGTPAKLLQAFDKNPLEAAVAMVRGKINSPSPFWFRKNLFVKGPQNVRPGDPVMVISASGAQGDDDGALNGHFAVGLAHVGSDFELRGEMYNVYVTNEKEIVPGNNEMNDYFGHLIAGQTNYRPTYTMLLYGMSEEKILKVKSELDRFHPLFRTGDTKITANANCATLTVQALGDIGLYGNQRNNHNGQGQFVLLSQEETKLPAQSIGVQLLYIMKTKRAEFMPGPAMTALLKNIKYVNEAEHLGITRADFVYGGQTPSARAVGSAPTRGILNQIKRIGAMKLSHILR